MASMSPNPFLIPLEKSAAPAFQLPAGLLPVPVETAAAPPAMLEVPPTMPVAFPAPMSPVAPIATVAPASVPAPAPIPEPPVPPATPSAGGWVDATSRTPFPAPDASGVVRDALLKIRRSRLSRIVKGIVGVSALVCLVAVGRAAIGGAHAEGDVTRPLAAVPAREASVPATVHADVDSLSARTLDAMSGVKKPATQAARHKAQRHQKKRR